MLILGGHFFLPVRGTGGVGLDRHERDDSGSKKAETVNLK